MSYLAKSYYKGGEVVSYDRLRRKSWLGRLVWRREIALLRQFLGPGYRGERVLDAPVGTGRFISLLNELGYDVVGVDISQDMLSEAKKKYQPVEIKLVRVSCEALTCFRDDEFDYVVSMRFMGHLPPNIRVGVLKEFERVSRKGVIVAFPIINLFTWLRWHIGNLIYRLRFKKPRNWWPVSYRAMVEEVNNAGLMVARRKPLFWRFHQIYYLHLLAKTFD